MEVKKSDWALFREARKKGMVASLTTLLEQNESRKSREIGDYFLRQKTSFTSIIHEEEVEVALWDLNEKMREWGIEKEEIEFPVGGGTETYLIPITENLSLVLSLEDNYFGDGEYSKYIDIGKIVINENTTKKDVDKLIEFL